MIKNTPPLLVAAQYGRTDEVARLLADGADPNETHPITGSSALMHATIGGAVDGVRMLLEAGANPRHRARNDMNALTVAVNGGDPEIVRALLAAGADPHQTDADGDTALTWAVHRRHSALVPILLQAGADPNTADAAGISALWRCIDQGMCEAAAVLLDAGADPNTRCMGGGALTNAAAKGLNRVVRALLTAGADPNEADTADSQCEGRTPLMAAAGANDAASVVTLLQGGADPTAWDARGRCAATMAASDAVLCFLVGGGAVDGGAGQLVPSPSIKKRPTKKRSRRRPFTKDNALLLAAGRGFRRSVAELLAMGADIDARDEDTKSTALMCALQGYDPGGAHEEAVVLSALVNDLLEAGADVTLCGGAGRTVLHEAADNSVDEAVVQRLLDAGADPGARAHEEAYLAEDLSDDKRVTALLRRARVARDERAALEEVAQPARRRGVRSM